MFFQTWKMLIYDRKDAILNAKTRFFYEKTRCESITSVFWVNILRGPSAG
jgi:hypothetical protein